MVLPSDLTVLILSYIPLKQLQLIDDQALVNNLQLFDVNILTKLLQFKYNINQDLTSKVDDKLLLEPFELYCNYAMLVGDMGYLGQFYLPPYVCMFYAVRIGDLELVQYYFLRYFDPTTNMSNSMKAIDWKEGFAAFINLLLYLAKKYSNIINYIVNTFSTFTPNYSSDINGKLYRFISGPDRLLSTNLNDKLYNISPSGIEKYVNQPFPQIDWRELYLGITFYDIITKITIKSISIMYDKVKTLFPPSKNRDQYLAVLDILLNNNSNLDILINNDSISLYIVALAYSVMNAKVVEKLIDKDVVSILGTNFFFVPSEVIYDTTVYTNYFEHEWLGNRLLISIYLNNKAVILKLPLPLVKKYQTILANLVGVSIYDPETAYRLSHIVDVKRYLTPLTDFDKDLMTQFGLLSNGK